LTPMMPTLSSIAILSVFRARAFDVWLRWT
jgi:hypothetical protein